MLMKFPCGCIGFDSPKNSDQILIVKVCDSDRNDPDIGMGWRDMTDKFGDELPIEAALMIIKQLQDLIRDGYRFREIKSALNLK